MACGGDDMDCLNNGEFSADFESQPAPLDGPDQHHVYIGYNRDDTSAQTVHKNVEEFMEQKKFLVYKDVRVDGCAVNINHGISGSQKVVILMTKSYMHDNAWFNYEKKHALEKVTNRSMPKSLALLLLDIEENDLPDDLQGYTFIKYYEHDENSLHRMQLLQFLMRDVTPDPCTVSRANMGITLACGHFYGYLRFVLPGLRDRILRSGVSEVDGRRVMSLKMFVVLPVSCQCPADMCSMAPNAISQCSIIPYNADKAGIRARDYKAIVYEITDSNKTLYRVVMEFPGTLTTLYDMVNDCRRSGMSRDECRREVDTFFFHLRALLASANLQDTLRIIYLKEHDQSFVDCIVSCIQEEIHKEQLNPVKSEPNMAGTFLSPVRPVEDSKLKVIRENDRISCYKLDVPEPSKRGKAFIFNNANFLPSSGLSRRTGTEDDTEKMKKLFELLRFDVNVFPDLTAAEMNNKVVELCERTDFRSHRAVVMCIMTHGKLGQLYGIDGEWVSITYLTRVLAQVETLHRKPKMFFIQACQRGRAATSAQFSTESITTPVSPHPTEAMETESEPSASSNGEESDHTTEQTSRQDSGISSDMSQDTGPMTHLQKVTQLEKTQPGSPIQAIGSINFHPPLETKGLDEVGTQVADSDTSPEDYAQADLVPGSPDFVMSYATLPGCLSWRYSCPDGRKTFYIDALCDMIVKHRSEKPLDRILIKVTEVVKEQMQRFCPSDVFYTRQFPFYIPTTDKLIYLD